MRVPHAACHPLEAPHMPSHADILADLATIPDPEMPISIVDLGLIEQVDIDATHVAVTVLPTFVGCPALPMIADEITKKLCARADIDDVDVRFVHDPPWSVDRISDEGRTSLRAHGVTVPEHGSKLPVAAHAGGTVELTTSVVPCPFCNSHSTTLESSFGPTRCRMIYYCNACKNTFEHMRRVE
jgi:ring-1,2-phenylacetyl-CoA epoxidase subunit PaaD